MSIEELAPELDERFSDSGATATPWSTTQTVLEQAQLSWISTVPCQRATPRHAAGRSVARRRCALHHRARANKRPGTSRPTPTSS
jgi:hypothetical protein